MREELWRAASAFLGILATVVGIAAYTATVLQLPPREPEVALRIIVALWSMFLGLALAAHGCAERRYTLGTMVSCFAFLSIGLSLLVR